MEHSNEAATMLAARIHDYRTGTAHVVVERLPIPKPKGTEALVKILASPLNPSDLSFIEGMYGIRKSLPVVPGFEACGRVLEVGEAASPDLVGARVACFAGEGDGSWAEYMLTDSRSCLPVPETIADTQAAMMLVNPLTAWALMDGAKRAGATAVVQTAAASALGQMIVRLGERMGITVVNIVRREAGIDLLTAAGARYILNSTEPTFDKHLRDACRTLDARIAFDAVGGEMTGRVLRAMPNSSTITVYGGLAGEPAQIGIDQLVFRDKTVNGFWLSRWMPRALSDGTLTGAWGEVQGLIGDDFRSEVRATYPITDIATALNTYSESMTGGKILVVPE